uniref:NADH-ubiquinone oxidoreductase chain 6 n=1 Tax=Ilyocoris cimicoides TaxID=280203 RepID=C5HIS3_9HEMI|nr:NADH dehydrogenase subunit 6 [Ilyocoris cimicoides]ACJ69518.1 NADH dehydrogenase subunit 6 [Ilyocoris cimicoides]
MMFCMIAMLTISLLFPLLKHPLSMGIMLIMQTVVISILVGMMIKSFWFSYILFIIFLGGALVLFIYMTSTASNEKFNTSMKIMLFIISMVITGTAMQLLTDSMMNNSIKYMKKTPLIADDQILTLTKLFNFQSALLTIMIVLYLLITMIAISHIVNIQDGPMRSKN